MKTLQTRILQISLLVGIASLLFSTAPTSAQENTPNLAQAALTSTFTYQGSLEDGGKAANSQYDFQFVLYDAVTGGNQIGTTIDRNGVDVRNGLFTVDLDFGTAAWNGSTRFLEVRVRKIATTIVHTTLSPRQQITATPYALYAAKTGEHNHLGQTWAGNGSSLQITGTFDSASLLLGNLATGNTDGLRILSANEDGIQVNSAPYGLYVESASETGILVAEANAGLEIWKAKTDGVSIGSAATGVKIGYATNTGVEVLNSTVGISATSTAVGVIGYSSAANGGTGVIGESTAESGANGGVYGFARSSEGTGVTGYATATTGQNIGVAGQTNSPDGVGILGINLSGKAGMFYGNVQINGTLSKSAGSFTIDHPLDPANKVLNHSFVESPDMMNIYNGNTALDSNGEVWIEMPAWFESLNMEFRYQLTPIGAAMPNLYVADEMRDNRFRVAGGVANGKVSWQVTGIRHDPYAEQNRIPVEALKPADQQGFYLYPQGYGQPESMSINTHSLQSRQIAMEQMHQQLAANVNAAQEPDDLEQRIKEKQE